MIDSGRKAYRGADGGNSVGEPGSSHAYMLGMIGGGKRVLEFGCASGYMSDVMARTGCRVTGIEIDSGAAELARAYCEEVVVADLDVRPLADILPAMPFDVAVFGDVLEHLRDPWKVLDDTRTFLRPTGYAVLSVPNIAHGSVRLALLRGHFDYTDEGLLDDTHLRFFTLRSIEELCLRAGYRIERIERTKVPLFEASASHPTLERDDFDPQLIAQIERDPEHDTLQFIVRAVPLDDRAKFEQAVERVSSTRTQIENLELQLQRALGLDPSGVASLTEKLAGVGDELASQTARRESLERECAALRNDVERLGRERMLLEFAVAERDRTQAILQQAERSATRCADFSAAELEAERRVSTDLERERRTLAHTFAAHLREDIDRITAETTRIDGEIRSITSGRIWRVKSALVRLRDLLPRRRH